MVKGRSIRGVCTATIIILLVAGIPVSAGGFAKHAAPGLANAYCLGESNEDFAESIQPTSDGNYVLAGHTNSNTGPFAGNHGGVDVVAAKVSDTGTIYWQLCRGGSATDEAHEIQQTTDGRYILIGTSASNNQEVSGNHGMNDIMVMKLDENGGYLWTKCLGGTENDYGFSIKQTSDHGYIVLGYGNSTTDDMMWNHGGSDIFVAKLNISGETIWKHCYGGAQNEYGYSILQTSDGGYIFTGRTGSNDGDVNGNHGPVGTYDVWVVKISPDGIIQWQRCFGGSSDELANSIRQTADGGYILTGTTFSNDGDVTGQHGINDVWVLKLNRAGAMEWQRCLGGNVGDEGRSIQQTPDGGYILTGYTGSFGGDVSGKHAYEDIWVVKLTSDGWPIWQRCLGGRWFDYGYAILPSPDGGYILCGNTDSDDGDIHGNHGSIDVWVAKFYGPPVLQGVAPAKLTTGSTAIIALTGENLVQQVGGSYQDTTVVFSLPGSTDITLPGTPYLLDGREIICQPLASTFLKPGIYNVVVITPDNQFSILPNAFTVSCGPPPTISSATPSKGLQGEFLGGIVIKGSRFWTTGGVTAYLYRNGQPNLTLRVTGGSATQLTVEGLIPAGAATGKWNLVVKNPDGQYAMKKDAFTVTLRTFKPPRVSSVTPKTVIAGSTVFINGISGSFFNTSAKVAMTGPRGVSIPVSNVTVLSDTKITCDANLTSIAKGYATVIVTNPDGKKSTRARAFSIR